MDVASIMEDTDRTPFCRQTEGQIDKRTDRWRDGEMDNVKPVYPAFNFIEAGGIIMHRFCII